MVGETGDAPLFTVLMPTHNRADVIGAAIRSVLNQTEQSFELLVSGDGCTDNTAEVVAAFDDPRVVWFDLPKGPGFGYENRNLALEKARGSLFAFMAHGDLLLPDHLARMGAAFQNPDLMWAYSRPLWIRDDGVLIPFFGNMTFGSEAEQFQHRNFIPASYAVFRRQLHFSSGGWPSDVQHSGDWTIWRRMTEDLSPAAIGHLREPTQLHFRANWRGKLQWAPEPLPYLSALADSSHHWPEQLRLGLDGAGHSPQEQVLGLIERDPEGLADRVRTGVELLQDEISWSAVLNQPFQRQLS